TAIQGAHNIASQSVRIDNLDPIPVTGSLVWQAVSDAFWLLVEPREEKTPGILTLFVNAVDLQLGTYQGNVLVRSLTPNVLFAERTIAVELTLLASPQPG